MKQRIGRLVGLCDICFPNVGGRRGGIAECVCVCASPRDKNLFAQARVCKRYYTRMQGD